MSDIDRCLPHAKVCYPAKKNKQLNLVKMKVVIGKLISTKVRKTVFFVEYWSSAGDDVQN